MGRTKIAIIIGAILIILGGFSIGYDQISYTRHEKILDIGPIEATVAREAHCVRLPVFFGAIVIAAGLCLVIVGLRKRS